MTREEIFYRNILDHLNDGIYFVNRDRRITFWNSSAERITGYSRDDMLGSFCDDNILEHINAEGVQLCLENCPLQQSMVDGIAFEDEVFLHHKDGHRLPVFVRVTPICNEEGQITGAVEIFNESTRKVEVEKRIRELEMRIKLDELTSIPRRSYMEQLIKNKLYEFSTEGTAFGVLFMDLDHFKGVNDNFGHAAGDLVLQTVCKTLKDNIRPSDMVARWGGEEFACLFHDITEENLLAVAKKLLVLVDNTEVELSDGFILSKTMSIGATLVKGGDTLDKIIGRADSLMYESKKGGRNRVTLG